MNAAQRALLDQAKELARDLTDAQGPAWTYTATEYQFREAPAAPTQWTCLRLGVEYTQHGWLEAAWINLSWDQVALAHPEVWDQWAASIRRAVESRINRDSESSD